MFHRFAAIAFAVAAAFAVPACAPQVSGSAGAVESAPAPAASPTAKPIVETLITEGDKRAAIGLMTAYTAAAKGAALAIRTKVITNKATIAKIQELNREAYRHVINLQTAIAAKDAVMAARSFNLGDAEIKKLLAAF